MAVVVLAGCGLEQAEERGLTVASAEPTTVSRARHPTAALPERVAELPQLARPDQEVLRQHDLPQTVAVTVKLGQAPGPDGKTLRVVIGQLGCGFWSIASGVATVDHGLAQVTLPGVTPQQAQLDLLVFRDVDGDGQCTAADAVWQTTLATRSFNSEVTLDLGQLDVAAGWTCFAFNP